MLFSFAVQFIIILALVGIIIVFARKNSKVAQKEKQLLELVKQNILRIKIKIKKQIKKQQKRIETKKQEKSGIEAMIEEQKYIKIITRDPKNIFAYQKLAGLYLEQKNYDDARAAFEQVLKIDSKNKKAKEELEKMPK